MTPEMIGGIVIVAIIVLVILEWAVRGGEDLS